MPTRRFSYETTERIGTKSEWKFSQLMIHYQSDSRVPRTLAERFRLSRFLSLHQIISKSVNILKHVFISHRTVSLLKNVDHRAKTTTRCRLARSHLQRKVFFRTLADVESYSQFTKDKLEGLTRRSAERYTYLYYIKRYLPIRNVIKSIAVGGKIN